MGRKMEIRTDTVNIYTLQQLLLDGLIDARCLETAPAEKQAALIDGIIDSLKKALIHVGGSDVSILSNS